MPIKRKTIPNHVTVEHVLKEYNVDYFPPKIKEIVAAKIEENDVQEDGFYFEEDEIKGIASDLLPFIKELHIKIEEEEKVFEVESLVRFETVIDFVQYLYDCLNENKLPNPLKQIIEDFNKLLQSKFDYGARNKICKLCEKCCKNSLQFNGAFITDTLDFLLMHTLNDKRKVTAKDIKRISNLKDVIFQMNMPGQAFEKLSGKLLKTVESPVYLDCKEGQQFIAFLLTYDLRFTKKVHDAIKFFLPDATKAQAVAFGKIYYFAWLNSGDDQRQAIETQCIQNLMVCIFTIKRAGGYMEMSRLGKNVFAVLSQLHESRKHVHLSKIITELYTPLIWRHLRSGNNIIRSNAAEVFLDVYPLEKPGSGRAEQADLLQRQQKELVDLLTDNCQVVRVIAVKGICKCLRDFWETFTPEIIQELIKVMVTDLINDGSCADVRKAVYRGFSKMVKNQTSAAYLAKVLPGLQNYIHDENEKVRFAFVEMLQAIKELPEVYSLKYWKIVPAEHLVARLAIENKYVGKPLVKLLMSEFYSPDRSTSAVLKRIYKIILMDQMAAKKLFAFSKDLLPVNAAVDLMINILIVINKRLKELEEINVENLRPDGSKKQKKFRSPLKEINSSDDDNNKSSNDSNISVEENVPQYVPHQLDNPDVCHLFIDIVTILWSVNSINLYETENEGLISKLQNICASCIPLFLRHFKGTTAYYAVIHLASLIPISKLSPISTISSMCISYLKSLTEHSKTHETEVYVNALCAWNRGSEILELATDWLDQAFRSEKLNQSAAIRSSARQRRVKFQHCEAKPLLALQLLDIMFLHETNRMQILRKNYNAIYDLFVFMDRIKTLIERRVSTGESFLDPQLSDKFLQLCLHRYIKLIAVLHKPKADDSTDSSMVSTVSTASQSISFDAPHLFTEIIDWAVRVLIPKLSNKPEDIDAIYESDSDNIPLEAKFLIIVAKTGCLLISANITNAIATKSFLEYVNLLLKTDYKLAFVNISFKALKELTENVETHYERDEAKYLRVTLPSLFINIISLLNDARIKKDVFASYVNDFLELRRCFLSLFLALIRSFTMKSQVLQNIIVSTTKTCIRIIADDIQEIDFFDPIQTVQALPNCSSFIVGALLSRENICLLWFKYLTEVIVSIDVDSVQFLGVISLLNTLSYVKKANLKEQLIISVKKALDVISADPEDPDKTLNVSLNKSVKDTLNARKLGTPVLNDIVARLGNAVT